MLEEAERKRKGNKISEMTFFLEDCTVEATGSSEGSGMRDCFYALFVGHRSSGSGHRETSATVMPLRPCQEILSDPHIQSVSFL